MAVRKPEPLKPFLPHPRPYYPWVIWCMGVLFQFYQTSLLYTPGILTLQLLKTFDITSAQLGLLAALGVYPFLFFQFPIGILIDKYGTRLITTIGITTVAFGAFLFGGSPTIIYAYMGQILIGIGASVSLVNIVKILSNFFHPKRFAFMMGLTFALGMLGVFFGEIFISYFVERLSWRMTIIDLGILGIIFALFFFAVMRDDIPGAKYNMNPQTREPLSLCLKRFLKKKQTWVLCLFCAFCLAPFPVFSGTWGVSFLRSTYHISLETAIYVHSSAFFSGALFAPLFGYLSTRFKCRKHYLVLGTFFAASFISVILFHHHSSITWLTLFYIGYGITIATFPIVYTVIHEQNVPRITASSIALINSFFALFGATGDQLIGFFLNFNWYSIVAKGVQAIPPDSFKAALTRVPIWLSLAFITAFFIKETHAKQKITEPKI